MGEDVKEFEENLKECSISKTTEAGENTWSWDEPKWSQFLWLMKMIFFNLNRVSIRWYE
jgi:hypothetical protein